MEKKNSMGCIALLLGTSASATWVWGNEMHFFHLKPTFGELLARRVSVSWSSGVQGLVSDSHKKSLKARGRAYHLLSHNRVKTCGGIRASCAVSASEPGAGAPRGSWPGVIVKGSWTSGL